MCTNLVTLDTNIRRLKGTGYTGNKGGSQLGETRLLLRLIPPDDIRNTTAIAKKLRRSVVIEEHFEFAIRDAHTVKISACAHCILRVPRGFRHTTTIVKLYIHAAYIGISLYK